MIELERSAKELVGVFGRFNGLHKEWLEGLLLEPLRSGAVPETGYNGDKRAKIRVQLPAKRNAEFHEKKLGFLPVLEV